MGQVAGYTAADYLIQHASRERRYARVPASTWDAILSHIRDPADAARLADSASNRLLYRYAIPLYRHAADAGDGYAAAATGRAAGRARRPGRGEQVLRARADAGDRAAAWRLAELLAERGDLDGLRARADAGDGDAAWRLAELLAERGDLDGAARPGRRRRRGCRPAAGRAAGRARRPGRGRQMLRARADAGDEDCRLRLAELLAERGDLDEAEQILRAAADAGDEDAAWRLAELLAKRGDLDGRQICGPGRRRRRGMPPGGWPSCWPSAATWTGGAARPGRRRRRGCRRAAGRAAGRARRPGRAARPGRRRRRVRRRAAGRAAGQARRPGRAARPGRRRRRVRRRAAGRAAGRARRPGRAARPGRRRRRDAARRLADLLAERGDLDGLRARADAGDGYAAWRLAELLAGRGDLDGLRARADAGDGTAARRLADLLTKQGRGEEAERLRRFGLNPDGSIACA